MSQNPYEQQGNPQQQGENPLANYQFSPDELKILRECNRESFFQRSLPIGTGLGLAAWWAVKNGHLKPSPRFGPGPKVLLGITIGYFTGKFSYQAKCAEKIMQLPNSRLGELLKQKKKGGVIQSLTPDQGFGAGLSMSPFSSTSEQYSDDAFKKGSGQTSALDLDTYRPQNSELDDSYRKNVDSSSTMYEDTLPLQSPKYDTTYEELRKKNRDEYAQRQQQSTYSKPAETTRPREDPPNTDDGGKPKSGRKNQYGDVWTP